MEIGNYVLPAHCLLARLRARLATALACKPWTTRIALTNCILKLINLKTIFVITNHLSFTVLRQATYNVKTFSSFYCMNVMQ